MNFLLDTHTLIWWLRDSPRLSRRARATIADADNEIAVSVVSLYEATFKAVIGKLDLEIADALPALLRHERFRSLPLTAAIAVAAGKLPADVRDPWDRIIAAQAIAAGWPVLTVDAAIASLGAKTIW